MNRMNNRIPRLAAFGLMLVAIAACTKTDIKPNDDLANGLNPSSGAPIAFVSQDAFTKAEGDTDPEAFMAIRAGGFKVWSWFKGTTEGPMFGENGTDVKDDNYVADLPEGQTQPDPNWTYSPLRYWLNGTYDFAAVYPSTVSGTYKADNNSTPVLTVKDFDVTNQDDLLVAFNTGVDGGKGNANNPVNLTFQHALSNIQLHLTLAKDDFFEPTEGGGERQVGYAFVSLVGFNKISTVGNLTASGPDKENFNWSSNASGEIYISHSENPIPVTLDDQTNFLGDDGLLVLPQSLENSNGELYMQVIIYPLGEADQFITKTFTVPLNTGVKTWEPNTRYIYKGVVTQELVIEFSVVKVNDWEEGDSLGGFIVS